MKLFQHPDFDQAILNASEHFKERGLRPAIIEKDYYVTEVLRWLSQSPLNDRLIFKGGTSLSKGWNLIQRFSEDIDLFLDPPATKRAIDRELKSLRDGIAQIPGLSAQPAESQTIGGFGRSDRFSYVQRFGGPGEVVNRVLLEAGTASGREPTSIVQLQSYLAQFLKETDFTLATEDESSFPFRLLHFRRTFVEKMFAIHAKVEFLKRDQIPIGTYARHYYDLHQLALQTEVQQMLRSPEYISIKQDYDAISQKHFPRGYIPPAKMSFANSEALFPPSELSRVLEEEYEKQCKVLCFGTYPNWSAVLAEFEKLRRVL